MMRMIAPALVLLFGGALAGAQQTPGTTTATPAQRFEFATDFERFVFSDTTRQQEWLRNYKAAGRAVAAVLPRANAVPGRWHVLVIAESWCNDAVNSVPWLARLAFTSPTIELRMLRKADAPELLQSHLLDGRAATPLVILYDENFVERGAWIERPAELRKLIVSKEGRVCEDTLKEAVKVWRLDDDGRSVLNEVVLLMERATAVAQTGSPIR